MRIDFTLSIAFFAINFTNTQFYSTAHTGYTSGCAEQKLGEIINLSTTSNSYGSYEEGFNVELRRCYFFNDTFGIDLGFSHLHGADQTVTSVNLPDTEADVLARACACGFSPAVV